MREYNPLSLRFIKDLQKVTVDNLNSISFSISSLISQILTNIKEINLINKDVSLLKSILDIEIYCVYQAGIGTPSGYQLKVDTASFSPIIAFNLSKEVFNKSIDNLSLLSKRNNVIIYQSSSIYRSFVFNSITDMGTYYQIKSDSVFSVGSLVVGSLLKVTFFSR